jgi:hypothetical protein
VLATTDDLDVESFEMFVFPRLYVHVHIGYFSTLRPARLRDYEATKLFPIFFPELEIRISEKI